MTGDLIRRMTSLAVSIQQIPAPTFQERQRAFFVLERFHSEGLRDVGMDSTGNVYARLPGGRGSPLVVSAHLDSVFPLETNLRVFRSTRRIAAPGIGDNAIGVAGLLGLVWLLRARRISLPGDMWLVATVGEEGLGNLRGMRSVVQRFGRKAQAYLVLEGLVLGQVYHRALGVRRYSINVHTAGGHSWLDYGQPSAVHLLTRLAVQITSLDVPEKPRTTLNVGKISGGTTVNTIAAQAGLELDLRSEGSEALADLARQVEQLVRASKGRGVAVEMKLVGERPSGEIPETHPLVLLAEECLVRQRLKPKRSIGSTDANIPLSRGLPSIGIGLTTGVGAHTVHECIEIDPLKKGMEQLFGLVTGAWDF